MFHILTASYEAFGIHALVGKWLAVREENLWFGVQVELATFTIPFLVKEWIRRLFFNLWVKKLSAQGSSALLNN